MVRNKKASCIGLDITDSVITAEQLQRFGNFQYSKEDGPRQLAFTTKRKAL